MKLLNLKLSRIYFCSLLEEGKIDEAIKAYYLHQKRFSLPFNKSFKEEKEESKKTFIAELDKIIEKNIKENKYAQAAPLCHEIFINDAKNEKNIKNYIKCLEKINQYDLNLELAKYLIKLNESDDNYLILSNAYCSREQIKEAIQAYLKHLNKKTPNDYQKAQLGYLFFKQYKATHNPSDIKKSFNYYTEALKYNPENKTRLRNTISTAHVAKKYKYELKLWHDLIKLEKLTPEDEFTYSFCAIQCNDFETYGKYYKSRFKLKKNPSYYLETSKPEWTGDEDVSNKTVLVRCEQGFGDIFLSYGYLPKLVKVAKHVIFLVHDNILDLLKDNEYGIEVLSKDTKLESLNFDYHIPSMSVCSALKLNKEGMNVKGGYIKANKKLTEKYKQKFFNTDKLKVGIAIKGNIVGNQKRDIPDDKVKILDKIKDAQLYCFTTDIKDDYLKKAFKKNKVINVAKKFSNFSDTAAAIENVDIIISTDNCILNLAGAMGKKVLGLFNYDYNLRWYELNENSCGYFDSVKPFVNDEYDRWEITLNKVIDIINKKEF